MTTSDKVNPAFLLDLVKFLLPVVFLAGIAYMTFETKTGAAEQYVRKEVFQQVQKTNEDDMKDIKRYLERIERKLDEHQNQTTSRR